MSSRGWSGRKVARLVALTLHTKGRRCHLCGYDGATSADHEPPRSELLRRGVPDPDALRYLFPSHLVCNVRRNKRPLTDALRVELRARFERDAAIANASAELSPRFARRRDLLSTSTPGKPRAPLPFIAGTAGKSPNQDRTSRDEARS